MDPLEVPPRFSSTVARHRWPIAFAAGVCACLLAAPARGAPPTLVASFGFAPSTPLSQQTVTFNSTSVATGGGNSIAGYRWDLDGDGLFETDTGTNPSAARSYAQPGPVTVSLQVTSTKGGVVVASRVVNVGNRLPKSSFTFAPAAPAVYEPVTFTSTATDPEGRIADLSWDLNGDGVYDNGSGPTVLRTFDRPGSYVIGLRVTDSAGGTGFLVRTISVASGVGSLTQPKASPGLRLLNPFPVVRIAGRLTSRGTRVRLLRVEAPRGTQIAITCSGPRCPFARQVRVAGSAPGARAARRIRVRRLERLLRPGVVVSVFVTSPDAIGKYTRFRIRRHKAPARVDKCLRPGSSSPVSCGAV